ncbi:MAG: ribonuclease E/G [Lachnospiraceae bacterium]|nr:ribonuclease E/G [Lachnospiraceae bacterium]
MSAVNSFDRNFDAPRFLAYRGQDGGKTKYCVLKITDRGITEIRTAVEGELCCGDIFRGRVEKYNANIDASFVDIGSGEFLFLKGRYKPGEELTVEVTALAFGSKLARCRADSANISDEIRERSAHCVKGVRLFSAGDIITRSAAEAAVTEGAKWLSEDRELYELAKTAVPSENIQLYEDKDLPLKAMYGLTTKLGKVLGSRVPLPSGGELVISETEAMCVVDVNTAKLIKGKDKEETFLKVNLEAASELALQLQARSIAGIIMVDFINMKNKDSETILISELKKELKAIYPPARLEDITKLGIAEISRQRVRGSIRTEAAFLNNTILA